MRFPLAVLAGVSMFLVARVASAQSFLENVTWRHRYIGTASGVGGSGSLSPFDVVGSVLFLVFSIVGVVFVLITIHGGFLWMTAGGNEDQVTKARQKITNGTIGIVIIFAAYLLTSFVMNFVCSSRFGVICGA